MTTHIYDADRRERATACDCLEARLRINKANSSADFDRWLFERLAVTAGEDVLDVGCGTGGQALHFARQVRPHGSVSALDIAADSVARLTGQVQPGDPVQAVVADMADLDQVIAGRFRVKRYDLAHSSYALYYTQARDAVLRVMRDHLKPGGRLAIFSPNGTHGLVALAQRFGTVPFEVTDCLTFGPRVMAPWYRENLIDVEEHHFHNVLSIPSIDDALMFYRATTYWDAAVEPGMQEEMARQIADHGAFRYEKNGYLIIGRVPA